MGKYTRKAKMTADVVAVMDVVVAAAQSPSSLGVRTRAKTLALQQSKPDTCYLELRSRRLEKPPHVSYSPPRKEVVAVRGNGIAVKDDGEEQHQKKERLTRPSSIDEDEGSHFGENHFEQSRGTRESTPCSLVKGIDTITPPGSTTKQTCSGAASQIVQNALLSNVPACELEEFFAHHEQSLQRSFVEKYNFDVVNDRPLPGRYDWVRVTP